MQLLKSVTQSIVNVGRSSYARRAKQARSRQARERLRLEILESRLLFAANPLVHQDDLDYLGAFLVPHSQVGQVGQATFGYGGTAPAYNPTNDSLFLVGHDWDQAIAEISIPEIVNSNRLGELNTASVLQPFVSVQSRIPNWTLDSPAKIGGLQVVDDELVGTFYEYYDGNGNAGSSHFKFSSLDLDAASVSGLHRVGNAGGGFVGGYMAAIPPEWQDELGAPYLTGQAALSIIGRTSAGPAAFGFDPDDLGNGTSAATAYVNYPLSNPLRPETSTNPLFNLTTEITGVVFPPNTNSVIFIGSHGTGQYCYGEASDCNDPVRGSKGTHSVGGQYEYQAWAYDVEDFIDVKNGEKQPWQIQPYDVWTFDLPFYEGSKHIGGVSYDAQSGRLYVSQQFADGSGRFPIINVFEVGTGSTPAAGPTISNLRSLNVNTDSAVIDWDTDTPANSRVEYGTTSSLGTFTPLNSALVTNHAVTLNNLSPDTSYQYRVTSQDASGQVTVSAIKSFTTLAETSPPVDTGYSYANPQPLAASDPATTVTVSNVSELINAVSNLQSGHTIAIAAGVYDLSGATDALYVPQGITNWTIRGATGDRDDVVIRGDGMSGSVRFGFWIGNSSGGSIADLTIDGVREHGIIANPGAHDILYHGLRIIDSGDQFIKSNPSGPGDGNDRGVVEYSIFEYRTTGLNNYTNGVDVHGGDGWVIRDNLFKNILSPAGQALAGPAILVWNGSSNTTADGNTFINTARGISFGLVDRPDGYDHQGGVIKNNMFYRDAGLANAVDVPIFVADSPGTQIAHNTILDLGNYPNAIEYRFGSTTNTVIRNNLTNHSIVARDGADGTTAGNITSATASMFVNANAGDLHLRETAGSAIDQGVAIAGVNHDYDGELRDGQPDIGADEVGSVTPPVNQPPLIENQSFAIDENVANDSLVGMVTASDPEGDSLALTILSGNTNNAFAIDADSGALRVNNPSALDYETRTEFDLTVQVADIEGASQSATVTIRLNDIDENQAPVISDQSFAINENSADGVAVGTVVATDPEDAPLSFSILSGNTDNAFAIDPQSGALRVNNSSALDYETRTAFSLTIQAVDGGGLSDAATVTVNLNDLDESVTPPVDTGYSYANPQPLAASDPATTVTVSNVSELINAVSNLQSGHTIAIAAGVYDLSGATDALYVPQGITNWTIRGATGDRDDVVIRGDGMSGSVRFGFWVGNSSGGSIADLTIDGVREHGIIANPGAHDILYHGLRIIDSGDQFIKSNPSGPGDGNDRGVVEYSIFEYRTTGLNNYTNGVDVHGGDGWVIRDNLFKNMLSPAGQALAGPAILMWNGSSNTTADGNTFINTARGISFGLVDRPDGYDHQGGVIKNNMFYRDAGLANAVDVPIFVADSPGTQIAHNTILDLGNYPNAIEYRFGSTTNTVIRNNLTNHSIVARDGADGTTAGNITSATASMFVNANAGDLHLRETAGSAIDQGVAIAGVNHDYDGELRDGQPDIGADEVGSVTPPVNQPPLIENQSFAIDENVANDSLVGMVTASDPEGDSLALTILSGNTNNAFAIDADSGALRVNNPSALDYETRTEFSLAIQAVDEGGSSDTATVTVNLNDLDESVTPRPSDGPIADFEFEEGRGRQTTDANGRVGIIHGARWTQGKVEGGLRFDGYNDSVSVADDDSLDLSTEMTLSMWVNPSRLGNWRTGILKETPNGLAYGLYVSDDNSRPAVYINLGGADLNATAMERLPRNTWSHLAGTYDGQVLRLFVNGKQAAQLHAPGSIVSSNSPLKLGGNSVWGEYFRGRMDEVQVYDSVLSADEIAQLAAGPGAAANATTTMTSYRNQAFYTDVNNDGEVTPLDALLIINQLYRFGGVAQGESVSSNEYGLDVNGDDVITPLDALLVINSMATETASEAQSIEDEPVAVPHASDSVIGSSDLNSEDDDELLRLLADDVADVWV